jgi:Zn-dependent M28 family amino/carboxypeptidase
MSDTDTDTDRPDDAWLAATFTSDHGWSLLESLVDLGDRMAGSPGEAEAASLTREALVEAGCRDARTEAFEIQGWERGDSRIEVGDTVQDCIALPRSPAGEATGRLVDVGHGLPGDFDADLEGAVVVAASDVPDHYDRFVHRREKYYRAVDAGAAAFVFRNHVPGCLPPTGSVGTADEPIGEIPAVGVSKEVGARLGRRFEGREATVGVDCEAPAAESHNVHAELGPATDEELLVSSHLDAHDIAEGAMDNGAGTATIVEVARALAAREDELDVRVRFVAYGAEEVGLVGSTYEAERADRESIRAVLNVDSNVAGRTLTINTHGFPELEAAVDAVRDRFDHPISTTPEMVPHSDHWPFVRHGVPGYTVASETEGRGRGWGHTYADTLDKLEKRTLREQAILLTELAVELASADRTVEHADPGTIAAALEEQGEAEGMRYTGDWPF